MTQEDFNGLPGLIRLGVFMEITGLNKNDVRASAKAGEIREYHAPGTNGNRGRQKRKRSRAMYYKADAGKLAGFKL